MPPNCTLKNGSSGKFYVVHILPQSEREREGRKEGRKEGRTEGKIEVNINDLGFGNDFLGMTPKAQATKRKQIYWTSSKLKTLCAPKDTTKK